MPNEKGMRHQIALAVAMGDAHSVAKPDLIKTESIRRIRLSYVERTGHPTET